MKDIKKIAAVHDISGFGKASLTAVIPILSTMGIQVCPLPTAVLSSISEFTNTRMIDLTDFMEEVIEHWQELDLKFDAVYSGFLGSPRQVTVVQKLIAKTAKKNALIVIDPVMGDNGHLYPVFTQDIIAPMQELITSAHVITPNITEAALLLDESSNIIPDNPTMINWLKKLADLNPQIVIITSVPDSCDDGYTCIYAYDKKTDDFWKLSCRYFPGNFPGTGDTFASIVTGCLMQHCSLPVAIERAANFIYKAIEFSLDYLTDLRQGIYLEPLLPDLLNFPSRLSIKKLDV
jgi:pyridoxine kinase